MMHILLISLALVLAACGAAPTPEPFVPTATPQGAIVPTRITATTMPSATTTTIPSRTPTPDSAALARTALTGSINSRDFAVTFPLEARNRMVVTLEMRALSGDLDPLLLVLGPDGREIARNDDYSDATLDARIANLTLEGGGQFTIVATRFEQQRGMSTGDFEISMRPGLPRLQTDAALSEPLRYNVPVSGQLNGPDEAVIFTFRGRENDIITIDMRATSGDLDPLLILTDNIGREIASNDDAPGADTTDARLMDVALPDNSYYTLIATTYEGAGGFELTLTRP